MKIPARFKPVTLPALLRQGACEFAWVNPKEERRVIWEAVRCVLGMSRCINPSNRLEACKNTGRHTSVSKKPSRNPGMIAKD